MGGGYRRPGAGRPRPGGGPAGGVSYNDAVTDGRVGTASDDLVAVTTSVIDAAAAEEWAGVPAAGAVVAFRGLVREQAEGRSGVQSITYEAYQEVARRRLAEVAAEARRRWSSLCRLALVHRVGLVALTEASVLVVVSAPHRGEAFDAARWCIDTLKETLPVWKEEHTASGSGWALSARPVRAVPSAGSPGPRPASGGAAGRG